MAEKQRSTKSGKAAEPRRSGSRYRGRGGIERKFLTAILWVGVIPMTLALIIGYVFAREGQWIAVQQNQSTIVHKTTEGIWLAMEGRRQMAAQIAQNRVLIGALKQVRNKGGGINHAAQELLSNRILASGELKSFFRIYSPDGELLYATRPGYKESRPPYWRDTVQETTFVDFAYDEALNRYATTLASRVQDADTGELLGYVAESQGVDNLLNFVLGRDPDNENASPGGNTYHVVYMMESEGITAYLDPQMKGDPPLRFDPLDKRLESRLRRFPEKDYDAFFLWRYNSHGKSRPVLMAYHRLYENTDIYFVVFRPVAAVFANINLGAVLTIVVSGIVIAIFCIIGYRIINNTIIRPVSLLNEGAQIIRQGDLELKLRVDTGDEIEELANSFNEMASTLRRNISQLETSEEKYRSLITSMRDGIYQLDPQGVFTFINPSGAQILGFAHHEEALGHSLPDLFSDQEQVKAIVTRLRERHFIEHTRVWLRKCDGQSICLELSANEVRDTSDQVREIEGVFRDVTQHVRLENEARERSERISAINQIANAINSSLEAGRVNESIVAEVNKLVDFDYAAVSLFEEGANTIRNRQLFPDLRGGAEAAECLPMAGSCAAWVLAHEESLLLEKLRTPESAFGSQFPTEVRSCLCVPLHATGRIIGTLNLGSQREAGFTPHDSLVMEQMAPHVAIAIRNAMLMDNLQQSLEEVTLAREKLHEANEELKTLDEMKTNLLSNVSHELRTPLVAVMGYTDMIINGKVGPINEVQEEYLMISLRNIEKLVTLIENLLDFSRLHRGAEELVFDTFDLVDCAKTSLQIVQPVADNRKIKLVIESEASPILVEGDKGKMGQVFNNLLSNAVKFNAPDGEVRIDMRLAEDTVEVTVSDTGIGIPEEALDKIFTRFYQYDGSSTRKYGGTGIGLSIAQDIMRLHGSRLTVSSEVGKGAVFRFTLALSTAQKRGVERPVASLPMPVETHLLVEIVTQERALSAQIRNLLLSEGMDVIHATYPSVAASLAARYNPDCILLDTESGPIEPVVIDELLTQPELERIPIILLTNDDELYERYHEAVAGRVRRGFRKSTLLSGIHYALSAGLENAQQLGNKILCVDDDPEIVRFITRCLTAEGYETESCASGEAAFEKALSGDFGLVLLDVAMPGLDGWETCHKIKAEASLAGIIVYLVTAKPVDKNMPRLRECGADGYLMKPFKPEELLALVQSFSTQASAPKKQAAPDHEENEA